MEAPAQPFDYQLAFSRNLGIFTAGEQTRLQEATVAIAGMGGVGGDYLITLARAGIGRFKIADFDTFELANFNRQYGATLSSLGQPKTAVMEALARDINPQLQVETFPGGVNQDNLGDFLDGCAVVVDGMEFFAVDTHRMLLRQAVSRGLPAVAAVPAGFGADLLVFTQDSMDFDDYFDYRPDLSEVEKVILFALGFAPRGFHLKYVDSQQISFAEKRGPSFAGACKLCSGLIATQVVQAILRPERLKPVPWYTNFDPYLGRFRTARLRWGNRHPLQRLKRAIALRQFGS